MTEHTKTFDEVKKEVKTIRGSIGDFYENETKQGELVGNFTLYESGDVVEGNSTLEFNDNKYKLVFYGEGKCNAVKSKLDKGMLVEATGMYRERPYKDKNEQEKISREIIVQKIDIVSKGEKKDD